MDLCDRHARQAKDAGVLLAINSDAHVAKHLGSVRYGLWSARRGWAEAKHVLNTRSLIEVRRRLHQKRTHRAHHASAP